MRGTVGGIEETDDAVLFFDYLVAPSSGKVQVVNASRVSATDATVGNRGSQERGQLDPMRITPIAALLCAASLSLLCAQARQSDADTKQLATLRAEAEKGDAQAQSKLADAYFVGSLGLARNEAEAVKWLRKAAEQNDAKAQHGLGVCYERGDGVAKDEAEAVRWYRKAAEQNYVLSQHNLGNCYARGQGVAKDYVEAVKWFRKAAEQNDARAQHNLGVCYATGQGVVKDEVEAVKWFRKAAQQNAVQAQHSLGLCYANGQGVAKDYVEAVKWYRKAAEQNDAPSQHSMGVCYFRGEGVAKDESQAVEWFRKAARQNNPAAQCNLGICYASGLGVTQDYVEAYTWLLLAGAQGDETAKKDMTSLEGQLTRQQLAEGQQRAASGFKPPEVPSLQVQRGGAYDELLTNLLAKVETRDAKAQNELGEAFYAGKWGVAKNAVAAVKWFRQAAEQNLAAAQSSLGVCYERGEGVAKYEVEAYKWDLLAAAQGDSQAKHNASMLELMLSQEQIVEGKRRAQDWLERRKKSPAGER